MGGLVAQCGRQARRCEHRERGALGDVLQDHGVDFALAFRGDRRSGRIEAQRDYLLGLIRRTADLSASSSATASLLKTHRRPRPACGGGNGLRYREPEGSGRRVFGGADPVKRMARPVCKGLSRLAADPVCFNVSGLEELPPAMMEIRALRSS